MPPDESTPHEDVVSVIPPARGDDTGCSGQSEGGEDILLPAEAHLGDLCNLDTGLILDICWEEFGNTQERSGMLGNQQG